MPDIRTEVEDRTARPRLVTPADAGGLALRPFGMLRRVVEHVQAAHPRTGGHRSSMITLPSIPWYGLTFTLFVVIPSLLSALYLWLMASDQFVAEARFAIRALQVDQPRDSGKDQNAATSIASGATPSLAGQDAYIVATYIRSAAVFADLPRELDPRVIYSRPEADFWAKLKSNASVEALTTYWRSMVMTYVDGPSGVVTVNVRAFRPSDAEALVQAVVAASERLVNTMSARARADAVSTAEAEVRRTEGLVRDALAEMRGYRNSVGFIDPASAAGATSQLLLQLMSERIRLQNDYFVSSRAMSESAPTVVTLKSRLEVLDVQIAQLRGKLTSTNGDANNMAASLVKYEQLDLKRIFAEKLYTMAQDSLERAKSRAQRQSLYLTQFVQPMLPEEAKFPQRLSLSLLIPVGLTILWGIMALISAAVSDHMF
jgi:capsular polysaccharide transport system permease protein